MPDDALSALSVKDRERTWHEGLLGSKGRALVAEEGGRVIGFAGFGPSRNEHAPPGEGEVYALYVLPDRWRSGVGGRLLAAAERSLSDAGFEAAILWVLDSNDGARRFYEALGWRTDEAHRHETLEGIALSEIRYRRKLEPAS
jgi:ribosomal protein S18 acetylase RimI-like enzyme